MNLLKFWRKPKVDPEQPVMYLEQLPKRTPETVSRADRMWPHCFRCDAESWFCEGTDALFETVECTNCGQRLRLAHFGSDGGTCVLQTFAYKGKNGQSKPTEKSGEAQT